MPVRVCRHPAGAPGGPAGVGKLPQGDIPSVPVARVVPPPAKDPFGTVGLADVLLAVGRVGEEVDALDLGEVSLPGGVAVVLDHLTQFGAGEANVVETGERHRVPVGDLQDGMPLCAKNQPAGARVAAICTKSRLQRLVAGFAGLSAANTGLLDDQQPFGVSSQTLPTELHQAGWKTFPELTK
jgi:hypothetical protein